MDSLRVPSRIGQDVRRAQRLAACLLIAWGVSLPAARAVAQSLPRGLAPKAGMLRESGAGTYRFLGIRIYDARLWVPAQGPQPEAEFVLGLRYDLRTHGTTIVRRLIREIGRIGVASEAEIEAWAGQLPALFPDVVAGDETQALNLPGRGVRFFFNGQPVGEVDDPAFARALFAVFLGEKARDPALRQALLGSGASHLSESR